MPHVYSRPNQPPRLVLATGGHAQAGSPEAEGAEQAFPLERDVATIGTGAQADVRLEADAVAERHAEIRTVNDGTAHVLVDLGSGTIVNGKPVQEVQLADGDRIEVGGATLTYRGEFPRGDAGRQGGESSGPSVQA